MEWLFDVGGVKGGKYCTINKISKGVLEVSEVWNTVLYYEQLIKGYVCQRCQKWYLWLLHNTVYRLMLLMLEVSKVYCTLYTVASCPCQEGRLFVTVFEKPSVLGVYWFTTSQSKEAALLTFLDLSNYKGDCRQEAQAIPNS